ncbi:hypothetical protein EBZ80_17655, partial [bacterium]|nr:hypothetical protein [bacterium]
MTAVFGLRSFLTEVEKGLAAATGQIPRVQVTGASDSLIQLALLGLIARRPGHRRLVVVLPESKDVSQWSQFVDQAVSALNHEVVSTATPAGPAILRAAILPYFAGWGSDRYINPSLSRRQRVYALDLLARPGIPSIIVTTAQALGQSTLSPAEFAEATITLKVNEEIDQDELFARLEDLGYRKANSVEEEGTYASRGAIVDMYPPNEDHPVRIEFLGDTMVSMR